MGFPVPTFNTPVNLWRASTVSAGPFPLPAPDLTFNANLSYAKGRNQYNFSQQVSGRLQFVIGVELLCPKLTDIRGHTAALWNGDLVEVPAGSLRLYTVGFVEDVAKGFSNEYRLAIILQLSSQMITYTVLPWGAYAWPQPTP